MSHIQDKVVLITGISSGIGEAAGRELAQRGAKVVLGARRIDRWQKLVGEIPAAGGSADCRALDVTNERLAISC
jgi:NADP-dependent 3-hydroxy acid dehydrogenase YdfG